jgi:transcriptional regulator with XRE-family HTH domain
MSEIALSETTVMAAKRSRKANTFAGELGTNIRRYREERRLTQRQLSNAARYDLAQLSAIENGLAVPRADALRRIADVLDVSIDRLCGRRSLKADGAETESGSRRTPEQLLSAGTLAMVDEIVDLRRRVERLEATSAHRVRPRSKT